MRKIFKNFKTYWAQFFAFGINSVFSLTGFYGYKLWVIIDFFLVNFVTCFVKACVRRFSCRFRTWKMKIGFLVNLDSIKINLATAKKKILRMISVLSVFFGLSWTKMTSKQKVLKIKIQARHFGIFFAYCRY